MIIKRLMFAIVLLLAITINYSCSEQEDVAETEQAYRDLPDFQEEDRQSVKKSEIEDTDT